MSIASNGYANGNSVGKGLVSTQPVSPKFRLGSEQLLRAYIANAPVVLYGVDNDGIVTLSEGKALEALGRKADEVVGKSIFEVFSDYPDILANIHQAFAGQEVTWIGEFDRYIYESRLIPLRGVEGEIIGLVGMATDVPQKKQAEEQLQLLAAAIEHAQGSILIASSQMSFPGPEIVFVNQAFTKMTGYTTEDVLGQSPRILQGPKTERAVLDRLLQDLREGKIFYGEAINYRKDGSEFYNEWHIEPICNSDAQITHYLAIQRDVTKRKQTEAQLRYAALYDALTDLPNRAFFMNQLYSCVEQSQESQDYLFAVLFLDIDRFKVINDSLGHK